MKKTCFNIFFRRLRVSPAFFTLIDLLVTIAVIAILAGMLLPAIGKAKTKVHTISCANIMRQIGMAITMYESDYQDLAWRLIYGENNGYYLFQVHQNNTFVANYMLGDREDAGYIGGFEHSKFKCPAYAYLYPDQGTVNIHTVSYAINQKMIIDTSRTGMPMFRQGALKHPSKTCLTGEVARIGSNGPLLNVSTNEKKYIVWFRHNLFANFLMNDGHVERMRENHMTGVGFPKAPSYKNAMNISYTSYVLWNPVDPVHFQ